MPRKYSELKPLRRITFIELALLMLVSLGLVMTSTGTVFAHGTKFEYSAKNSFEIIATYDDGTPLSEAQVTIYSPNDPSNAWGTGVCDTKGHYIFTPDPSIAGNWSIQIRKAGHGGILNIPVSQNADTSVKNSTAYSPGQITLMMIAIIWGFVGTALYFKRERK